MRCVRPKSARKLCGSASRVTCCSGGTAGESAGLLAMNPPIPSHATNTNNRRLLLEMQSQKRENTPMPYINAEGRRV
jgi:hypothetical protein